jgi:hypothetical protein
MNIFKTHKEFYSAIKKNEIMSFAGKWMEMEEVIMSSEVSQSHVLKKTRS